MTRRKSYRESVFCSSPAREATTVVPVLWAFMSSLSRRNMTLRPEVMMKSTAARMLKRILAVAGPGGLNGFGMLSVLG